MKNSFPNSTLSYKLLIAGVGGQGVVFLTNLLVEAALLANIPVAASEIHGLAQRGGSVNASLTFGSNTYGFIEEAGADFLLGLEPLESQRCLPYLHKDTKAVIDNYKILPYSVNAGQNKYPDVSTFIRYLKDNIQQVIFIEQIDKEINPIMRNLYVLGKATLLNDFPLNSDILIQAIEATARESFKKRSTEAFMLGLTSA